jgi:hypothetical protein
MNDSHPVTQNNLKYQVYLEERKALISAEREGARLFDRSILTLAAGAFGLSLLFIRQIAPEPEVATIGLLQGAWGAFGASILSTLVSFLTSQSACAKQREILELDYFENDTKSDGTRDRGGTKNWLAGLTRRLNWLSIICFAIGAFFLAAFSFYNLQT